MNKSGKIYRRFAAIVAYDGTDFYGFQNQPGRRTVQGVFEEALVRIHDESIQTEGAGRTDTGVHAWGQVIAFNTTLTRLDDGTMKNALNANLPPDLIVRRVESVSENFSPRFAALKRVYNYYILNRREPSVFLRRYTWLFPYELDLELMRNGAEHLLGEHDFSAFRTGKDERSPVRTVLAIRVLRTGRDIVLVRVEGVSFLRRMVRNIVGTLARVGIGYLDAGKVKDLVLSGDRSVLPSSAPAQGLFFHKAVFEEFES